MVQLSRAATSGYVRAMDIMAVMRKWPVLSDGNMADYDALKEDWEIVGKDITSATHHEAERLKTGR